MKKEEKVVEVLREEGYKISEEDVLIAQLVPGFFRWFNNFYTKTSFFSI